MLSVAGIAAPGLTTFIRSARTKGTPIESSIENLVSLLKRRQIRSSKDCAIATIYLLQRVVEASKLKDAASLIERVQQVGQRLVTAQPRELAVGNIVRRVLGIIREEAEEDREGETNGCSNLGTDSRLPSSQEDDLGKFKALDHGRQDPESFAARQEKGRKTLEESMQSVQRLPPLTSNTSCAATNTAPPVTSMFSLLSRPLPSDRSPNATAGSLSPRGHPLPSSQASINQSNKDFKAEVIEGIQEVLDEINQADDQIAGYALEHIHSSETILTYSSSVTVQKFLVKAAAKRKFTVMHAEAYPNHHESTHATILGKGIARSDGEIISDSFTKTLTAAGITVILIPDSATFALMSRVNKVVLSTHAVLADGSLVAAAGSKAIAKAARMHRTNLVVPCAIYQLSPVYPFDPDSLMEAGDPSKVMTYACGELIENIELVNPLIDHVPAELVDLYITNIGGFARPYLYRIIQDHYRNEDAKLDVHYTIP